MSISYTADQLQRKFQGAPGASGFARIAETLREEGRLEEAVALCREGLQRKPQELTGRLVLGKCLLDMDRLDEAREQLEGVLRQDPRCLSAMHLLARIMTKLQWGEAATAYYRSILEIEPWDAESMDRFRQASPAGAAGLLPGAQPTGPGAAAGSGTPPIQTLEALEASAPKGPQVEEFDLNDVTGFPSAESSPGDLAGALEEVSLEDALSGPAGDARGFAPAQAQPAFEEPKPLDILTEAAPAPAPGADEPVPISGDDVGDRLDSLFGSEDGMPISAAPAPGPGDAEPGRPDADFADATLQLKALRDQEPRPAAGLVESEPFPGSADGPAQESAPDLAPEPPEEAVRRDAGFREEPASPLETSVFSGGDLLAPEERVSGEDIEARLDDLFSLHDTSTQPVMKAIPDETDPSPAESGPDTGFPAFAQPDAMAPENPDPAALSASPAPEAVGTWSGAPLTDTLDAMDTIPVHEEVDAEPPADGIDDRTPAVTLSEGEVVTGQDVADKLEALFGEENPLPGGEPKAAAAPVPGDIGSASWAAARPFADEAEAAAGSAAATGFAAMPAADAAVPAEDLAPAWDLGSESSQAPQSPPITGQDIEDRLDSLFDIADESPVPASTPRVETPVEDSLAAFPAAAPEEVTAEEPLAAEPAGHASGDDPDDGARTLMMPTFKESPSDWLARQDEAPGSGEQAHGALTGPAAALDPRNADSPGSGDTLFISNEDVFADDSASAPGPSGVDTVGLEMVDGADIAERLDQIFASEEPDPRREDAPAAAAKAAAEAAIARGEAGADGISAFPEPEDPLSLEEPAFPVAGDLPMETGSGMEAAAPQDEIALFAEDPAATLSFAEGGLLEAPDAGETMISGEDIKARLSEIFDAPAGEAIRPMEDEDPETPLFLANPGFPAGAEPEADAGTAEGAALASDTVDAFLPMGSTARTPAADAGTRAPETGNAGQEAGNTAIPSLSPLQDEEEGSPDEEEIGPQSAAGANVATVTLAEIYFQQGLREQALQIYRQLLEREPGNDSVRKRIQEIEASKPEAGTVPGTDPRRPRPGLKVPKRKK